MKNYMSIAIKEAKKSLKYNDVPVGCVIVNNGKVIAKSYNKRENWHLENCILYTTLEPCLMCFSVISQCRIKKVIYALKNEKNKININNIQIIDNDYKKIVFEQGNYEKESLDLLQEFFSKKRK